MKPIENLTYNELGFIRRGLVILANEKKELAEVVSNDKLKLNLLNEAEVIENLAERFEQVKAIVLLAGPEESYNIKVSY